MKSVFEPALKEVVCELVDEDRLGMAAMGVFSSLNGDIPGDLPAIDHLAARIHDQAEAVQIVCDEFRTTIQKTTIWAGRSREAFEDSANRQQYRFAHLYEGLETSVTLINPHGENRLSLSQTPTDHGEFSMTWSEFEKYFGYITIGEIP